MWDGFILEITTGWVCELGVPSHSAFSVVLSEQMENSQLDTKISGMKLKVGQKRDSILAQTSEAKSDGKDKSSSLQATPAKVKCSQRGLLESTPGSSGQNQHFGHAEMFFFPTWAAQQSQS